MKKEIKALAKDITSAARALRPAELFDGLVEAMFQIAKAQAADPIAAFEEAIKGLCDRGADKESSVDLLIRMFEAIDDHDGDTLGDLAAELGTLNGHMGQFFTPFDLGRLLTGLSFDEDRVRDAIRERGYVSLSEPAAGSGGLVLAFAQHMLDAGFPPHLHMFAEARELDRRAFQMCFVQLSVRKIPARVVHCNTLTMEEWEVLYTPAYRGPFSTFQAGWARWKPLFDLVA